MLDMGFAKPIERIVATLPKDRHTLLFSATMPKSIASLAESLLRDPGEGRDRPALTTVDRIEQSVMFVDAADKRAALLALLRTPGIGQAVVFTLQKNIANEVCAFITAAGITAEALHGNKSQGQRERALDAFRTAAVQVLVATDIAARGIDVDTVTHVFNHDLPSLPESYVHRIGRTGRAGRSGFAITLCDAEQRAWLRDVRAGNRSCPDRASRSPVALGSGAELDHAPTRAGRCSGQGNQAAGKARAQSLDRAREAHRAGSGQGGLSGSLIRLAGGIGSVAFARPPLSAAHMT